MKKLITMCLLIIGLVVTGCGSSGGNGSLNTPVIYNVTPTDSSSIASSVDDNGNITVTLTGRNFGSQEHGEVWYNGYQSDSSSEVKPIRLTLAYGGSWTDNSISVNLVKITRESFPNGSFFVIANGQQSPVTSRYNFGAANLNDAVISSISPSVFYSYDNNASRYITISGNGFGTIKKDLTLFSMSGSSNGSMSVSPLYWSNESITFMMPENLVNITSNIGIKITETGNMLGNNSWQYPIKYVVFNPAISNVSPSQAYLGQEVTINSYNGGFGENRPAGAYLTIGNVSVYNIVSWSDYSIRFVIPENASLPDGQTEIKIYCNGKILTGSITLIPHITSITVSKDSGILSSTYYYTVNGSCFSNNTTMYITNNPSVSIVSYNSNSIVFSSSTDLSGRSIYFMGSGASSQSNSVILPSAS